MYQFFRPFQSVRISIVMFDLVTGFQTSTQARESERKNSSKNFICLFCQEKQLSHKRFYYAMNISPNPTQKAIEIQIMSYRRNIFIANYFKVSSRNVGPKLFRSVFSVLEITVIHLNKCCLLVNQFSYRRLSIKKASFSR